MFDDLQKRSFKKSLPLTIILLLIGLVLVAWNAPNIWSVLTGYTDFGELKPGNIRSGRLVDYELPYHYGSYLEEYTQKNNGPKKTTYIYYLIETASESGFAYDDTRLMTAKVPVSYEKQMENYDEDGYLKAPVAISGKIRKLSSEDYDYLVQTLHSIDWTDEDIENLSLPYYIDVYGSKTASNVGFIILFAGGIVILIMGVARIIKGTNGGYLKKLRQDIANAGYTESAIESDYRNAHYFDKKGSLRMGSLMTYYITGAETRAIPNNKMMWAYQNTVTHRTNGIKTGTSYNVMIYAEDAKSLHTLSVPNEATAQDMLQRINNLLPWVVVGYTDELKKLFNKERQQFLQIRYNTCEHVAVEPGFENAAPEVQQ